MSRRLLPVLLLAFALHWMVLDFWRGQGMFGLAPPDPAPELQVRLPDEAALPAQGKLAEKGELTGQAPVSPVERPARQSAEAVVAGVAPDAAPRAVIAPHEPAAEMAPARASVPPSTGFREMNVAEAIVAYRMDLAQRLDPKGIGADNGRAKLIVVLGTGGAANSAHFEDGRVVPMTWESAIRTLAVPTALKGRIAEVVLEIDF